ncbi:heme-binding protein [bacterium]|nr:heme-binding protein [bacterium]
MNILLITIGVVLVGWFLYSWLPVRNIEEPKYAVVSENSDYEIREYAGYIIAETTITGAKDRNEAANMGFPIIAGYIFGNNTKNGKIAMTVPVNTEDAVSEKISMTVPVNTEESENNVYKISFVMPSKYSLDTLPKPNDARVELREVPERQVAVRTFSWTTSEAAFEKQTAVLLEALMRDGVETTGAVNIARYNTPWTIPFMLRSEVQIEVR